MTLDDAPTVNERRPELTEDSILLMRGQAIADREQATVAICDVALGRAPDARDLARLAPEVASTIPTLTRRDAIAVLVAGRAR